MERRVRGNSPARCGSGEKTEVIASSESYLSTLQTAARTLIFLKENGIDSYDELDKTSTDLSSEFSALTKRIKEIETKQKENNELQKYIGNYGKTREIYKRYVASGRSRDFYDVHATNHYVLILFIIIATE